MARPAAVTPDQIRATVLAMLAEAGEPGSAVQSSVTHERFRQAVSVRRLRARLGAGDPAVLSRALNTIEAELVQAGIAQIALPDLPEPVAEQMRALWQTAVSVQLDDVVRLKAEARAAIEAGKVSTHEAEVRVELLQVELADLRAERSARDTELATAHAECRAAVTALAEREQSAVAFEQRAESAARTLEDARAEHAAALAAAQARYEGLSKRLLQETEHQRHALMTERERLNAQVTDAQTHIAALEGLRERLLDELASERDHRRQAAAEAAALATVVTEQRHALDALRTWHVAEPGLRAGSIRPRPHRPCGTHRAGSAATSPRPRTRRGGSGPS